MNSARILLLTATLFQVGCSTLTPSEAPRGAWAGYEESGKASFYASRYHDRRTASGERFDNGAHTAAHRKLPFGTRVRVTNRASGKSVVVRINDRGPFVPRRIIDLSRAAFAGIGDPRRGVIDVHIEVLD